MNYLRNRTSTVELKGIAREISIETGCPQGGILSVLLWNVAFDMLLSKFTKGRVRCIGFADDGTLLINGKDLHKMRNQMQTAINKVSAWARERALHEALRKHMPCFLQIKRKYRKSTLAFQLMELPR